MRPAASLSHAHARARSSSPARVVGRMLAGRSTRSCQKRPLGGAGSAPSEPHAGVGTLRVVAQHRPGQRAEARQRLLHAGGVGPPGVHGGGGDAVEGPPVGQQGQHLHLHPLGAGVGRGGRVLAAAVLRVVGPQRLAVHPAAAHQHDATTGQPGPQRLGHHDRTDDVHGHAQLVALRRLGPLGRHHAGVVHDPVDGGQLGRDLRGEAAYVVDVTHVAAPQPQRRPGPAAGDLVEDATALGLVAHHEVHAGAERGETLGGGDPQPRACAGDEHVATGQGVGCRVGGPARQRLPHAQPDGRVAQHQGPVEDGVERPHGQRPAHARPSRQVRSWSTVFRASTGRYAATSGAANRAAPLNANSAV